MEPRSTLHRPERLVAFAHDRVCNSCNTRYTPPTPGWAGIVFILIGLPLAGFGVFAVIARVASGNPLGIPAMAVEALLAFAGLLATVQGIRALIRPGRA